MNIRLILAFTACSFLSATGLAQSPEHFRTMASDPAPRDPSDHGVQARFTVLDADGRLPIELAHVVIRRNGRFVTQDATNPAGLIRFRDLVPGWYNVSAWFVGYNTYADSLLIDATHSTYTVVVFPDA